MGVVNRNNDKFWEGIICNHVGRKRYLRGICYSCYTIARYKSMPPAKCHPERREHCGGLCRSCYRKGDRSPKATCHPNSPHIAKGLCAKCYNDLPENKDRRIKVRRLKKYNLSNDEYEKILSDQGWLCPICGGEPTAIDHDHTTGIVRGALCKNCNAGIGLFKDDINILNNAIKYLKKAMDRHE